MQRIELHTHTGYSQNDGVIDVREMLPYLAKQNINGVAITDHGTVSGYFLAQRCLKWMKEEGVLPDDFKLIYGAEVYLVDDLKGAVYHDKGQSLDTDFVVVDIETTGLRSQEDSILYLMAVKVIDGKIRDHFYCVTQTEQNIPEEIAAFTGITTEMTKEGLPLKEALEHLVEMIGDLPIVSHNADYTRDFLQNNCLKFGFELDNTWVDTLALSYLLLPNLKNYRLDSVAQALGIEIHESYEALEYAFKIVHLYLKLKNMLLEQGFKKYSEINPTFIGNEEFIKSSPTFHTTILVKDMEGLKALYHIMSDAGIKYFNTRPKMPKSLLAKNRDHLLIGSACEAGEVFLIARYGCSEEEMKQTVAFYDYLEVQTDGNNQYLLKDAKEFDIKDRKDLHAINQRIVTFGEQLGIPVVATSDAHYLYREDAIARRALRYYPGYEQDPEEDGLYLHTTEELMQEFAYLGEETAYQIVIENTNKIADQIQQIYPFAPLKQDDSLAIKELRKRCLKRVSELYGEQCTDEIKNRLELELQAAEKYGYAHKFIWYADAIKLLKKRSVEISERVLANGSFIAFLLGITEVNPIQYHILPYDSVIDGEFLNIIRFFAADDQIDEFFEVWEKAYGKDHVIPTVGIYRPEHEEAEAYLEHYLQETGDTLDESKRKRVVSVIENGVEDKCFVKTHRIIVPDGIDIQDYTSFCLDDYGKIVADFQFWDLKKMFLCSTIFANQDTKTLLDYEQQTGIDSSKIDMNDKNIQELLCNIHSEEDLKKLEHIEFFQQEENRKLFLQLKPKNFEELAQVYALTEGSCVWEDCQEPFVQEGIVSIENIIATRDDVLDDFLHSGMEEETSVKIAERVRKGKGLTEDQRALLKKSNFPEWFIHVCNTVKYLPPRGRSISATMQIWRLLYFVI